MRRMAAVVIVAIGLGLAINGSPALTAGGRTDSVWFPGAPGPAQPYLPVVPIDPQPQPSQPVWIIRVPF